MERGKFRKKQSTSREPVQTWYDNAVGKDGLYYHRQVILPGVLRLMELHTTSSPTVLDLACGQGILAKHLSPTVPYIGIDLSPSLIRHAQKEDLNPLHRYFVADVTQPLPIKGQFFSHAAMILAAQNMEKPQCAFKEVAQHLLKSGKLVIVLNHPCFRVPRQSSWQVDPNKKVLYRRLDQYSSSLRIPIQAHPSQHKDSPLTWTFHHPVQSYTQWLKDAGFMIELMEEWCSDKVSTGSAAKMENRSRQEFPLFLTIIATKTA